MQVNDVNKASLREVYKGFIPYDFLSRHKVTFSDSVSNKEDQSRDLLNDYFKILYGKKKLIEKM